MPARIRNVNLLPPTEFEMSFGGRFLKWAVTTGRYIIILTELVVILAFLSRFKLDYELSVLTSKIEGKVSLLEANSPIEREFKSKQARLEAVKKILTKRISASETMDSIAVKTPPEVKLTEMTINGNEVEIDANSFSEKEMGEMIAALDGDKRWSSVEISSITQGTEKVIKFRLNLKR